MRSVILLACCAAFLPLSTRASAQATKADSTDPYLWLEDVNGARAMAWVKAENAKTTADFEANPSTIHESRRMLFSGTYKLQSQLMVMLDPDRLNPMRLSRAS